MPKQNIQARQISAHDATNLLTWRNDPEVRALQGNTTEIQLSEHRRWFSDRIKVIEELPFLAYELQDQLVGYVRLEIASDLKKTISILIAKNFRGQGFGYTILSNFLRYLESNEISGPFFAHVHEKNLASQRLFESVGFTKKGQTSDNFHNFVLDEKVTK